MSETKNDSLAEFFKLKMKFSKFQNILNNETEAFAWRYTVEKVFLVISQNSQQNTCATDSFLIKLQVSGADGFL